VAVTRTEGLKLRPKTDSRSGVGFLGQRAAIPSLVGIGLGLGHFCMLPLHSLAMNTPWSCKALKMHVHVAQ